jgi:hypothetical protein
MEILLIVLLIFLAMKLLDVVRYIVNADMNGMVTQVLAWLAGILVVYITVWAEWITVFNYTGTRIVYGLLIGSGAAVTHDLLKAIAKASTYYALIAPRVIATPTPTTPAAPTTTPLT